MEIRGVPSLYVATVQFEDGADVQAQSLGFEHSAVYVEHPIQDRTDAEMVEIADEAYDLLVQKLVQ
jgi:hypothetical protein